VTAIRYTQQTQPRLSDVQTAENCLLHVTLATTLLLWTFFEDIFVLSEYSCIERITGFGDYAL